MKMEKKKIIKQRMCPQCKYCFYTEDEFEQE